MNKKVATRRPKTTQDLTKQPGPVRMRQLERRSRDLGQEIHRLECTIAAAPRVIRENRLATMNTLPPPERTFTAPARRRNARMPLQKQRAIKRQRFGLICELVIVLTILAAALGWMNQWFHFWN